jgi:hypothetical protein
MNADFDIGISGELRKARHGCLQERALSKVLRLFDKLPTVMWKKLHCWCSLTLDQGSTAFDPAHYTVADGDRQTTAGS